VRFAEFVRKASPGVAFVAPQCARRNRQRPEGRIHVGFVSAHLHNHTIGKLNAGLIGLLDRERFVVTVFRNPTVDDAQSERIAGLADACVRLEPKLEVAQAQIADREPDVLVYTDIGMDALTYYLAHARLAPVQCTTWGHPVTTGIGTMDYFISSRDLEVESGDAHYSEKLVRLAHLANYYLLPAPPSSKSRKDFGLPDEGRLYGCLQSTFKVHPDDDEVLGEILRRDRQGHLLLLHTKHVQWSQLLRERFARTMGDVGDRIHFMEWQLPHDFSQLLATVDALVDPLHFGGGDTSYQSFAVGAPVVTLPSEFLRGRITYALYRTMGIDDLIATDRTHYVELALRLASDRQWHEEMSAKILAASDQIFLNSAGVSDLEEFLLEAVASARR
jgi:predicted O-linked N-acetylglucosamine transferase (SPINDLY family)